MISHVVMLNVNVTVFGLFAALLRGGRERKKRMMQNEDKRLYVTIIITILMASGWCRLLGRLLSLVVASFQEWRVENE